jgi:hypothetical protein
MENVLVQQKTKKMIDVADRAADKVDRDVKTLIDTLKSAGEPATAAEQDIMNALTAVQMITTGAKDQLSMIHDLIKACKKSEKEDEGDDEGGEEEEEAAPAPKKKAKAAAKPAEELVVSEDEAPAAPAKPVKPITPVKPKTAVKPKTPVTKPAAAKAAQAGFSTSDGSGSGSDSSDKPIGKKLLPKPVVKKPAGKKSPAVVYDTDSDE